MTSECVCTEAAPHEHNAKRWILRGTKEGRTSSKGQDVKCSLSPSIEYRGQENKQGIRLLAAFFFARTKRKVKVEWTWDENVNLVDQFPLVTLGLWHLQLHRPAAQQSAQLCDRFGIVINRHAGRCGGFNQVGWSRSGATMAKKKKNWVLSESKRRTWGRIYDIWREWGRPNSA